MRARHRRSRAWYLPPLLLGLFACGNDRPTEPVDPAAPAAIAVLSGDQQEGTAGEQLSQPFVVRVTNSDGRAVPEIPVSWRVTSGEGRWLALGEYVSGPILTTTDADGVTTARFQPTTDEPSTVAAKVQGNSEVRVTLNVLPSLAFPPAPASSDVYLREAPDEWGLVSRYVLHEGTAFELQFLSDRFFSYTGQYSRSGSVITFDFDASNTAGPWKAEGTLHGDRLNVEYNAIMWLADFRDGTYVLDE